MIDPILNTNSNSGSQSVMIPPQQPQTQPQAPPVPSVQPLVAPNAQPNQLQTVANNGQPQARPQTQSPQPRQHDLFRTILSTISDGNRAPVRDVNGNPVTDPSGRVVTQPMRKRSLAASILAGALSSMLAGYEAGAPRYVNGMWNGPNVAAAGAAGAQAAQANSPNARVQQAQAVADKQRLAQYAATDQNLKLHAMALALDRQGDDAKLQSVSQFAPIYQAAQDVTLPDGSPLILKENISEDELQKLMQDGTAHVTRDSAIPTSTQPEIDPDGKPTGRLQLLWTVFRNSGRIPVTDELKAAHPEYADVLNGTQVPIGAFVNRSLNAGQARIASTAFEDVAKLQSDFSGKPAKLDWAELLKQHPSFKAYAAQIGGLAGLDPDQFVAAAKKISPELGGAIQQQLNVDADAWANKREADKKKADQANDPDKQPVSPALLKSFGSDIAKSYPSLTAGQINVLSQSLGPNATQGDYQKVLDRAEQLENANTNRQLAQQRINDKAAANDDAILTTPDALGVTPNVPGGLKEYNKRQNSFKKNVDDLQKTEGTFQQFNSILNDINAGKDLTGAQSVVALFNAIGISATPLAGKGFRINQNTIAEHADARGLGQSLYQKLLGLKSGDVITPQQIKDYAQIAEQARQSQYIGLVNEVHNQGLNANFVLPTGNGEHIDPSTARIFMQLAGGNPAKARQAAMQKGWQF